MVIDIHGHLGNINFSQFWQADADQLVRYLKESGTDKLCLSASRAIMYDIFEGNAELDVEIHPVSLRSCCSSIYSVLMFITIGAYSPILLTV